jgi:parvulin-like peptidyl-prolyl isomerase
MVPPFDDACFDEANPPGTLLGPIPTVFGNHLIWVHERTVA